MSKFFVLLFLVGCGTNVSGNLNVSAPSGKTFGMAPQSLARACTVAADGSSNCDQPAFAECRTITGSGETKVCLYQPCTPGQSICPTELPVCDEAVSYCRRVIIDHTIPPSDINGGGSVVPVADAGAAPDAGVVVDAGIPAADGGMVTPIADAGLPPSVPTRGVVGPVPSDAVPVAVPEGTFGVLCMSMNPARVWCGNAGRIALWNDPTNWSEPSDNGSLSGCWAITTSSDLDSTIRCGQWSQDYDYGPGVQTARMAGYEEVSFYMPGGVMVNLLDTAVVCFERKLRISTRPPFDPPSCQ